MGRFTNTNLRHLIFLFLLVKTWDDVSGAKTVTEIIDSLFPEKSKNPTDYYDKGVRPNYGDKPVKVTVSAYILDVYNVDEKNHEFTTQLYFRQQWVDPRLGYQPPPGVNHISLNAEQSKKLWTPDTFILNERSSIKHDLTVENLFSRIQPDGEVLQSRRITVTAGCKMNLKWFPFDRHICSLVFESYGHMSSDFYYEWAVDTITAKPRIGVSSGAGGSINQEVRKVKVASANAAGYSRVAIEMLIVRSPVRFLQDVYFPAFVIVTIAFITMSVGALHFKVLLSVICMVVAILFTSTLAQEMPKVSYQTALDFYVFKCSFMVFNVVIVNFIMYHLLKPQNNRSDGRIKMRQLNGSSTDEAKEILPEDGGEGGEEWGNNNGGGKPVFDSRVKEILYMLCKYSQYTMPCFFLLFNLIYWIVVLVASNNVGDDTDFMLLENTVP